MSGNRSRGPRGAHGSLSRADAGRWNLRDVLAAMGLVFGTLAVSLLVGIAVVELPRWAGRLEPLTSGESSSSWEWRRGRSAYA